MAGTELTPQSAQRICAVRLPGTSRARFADAGTVEVLLGDWVVVATAAGEEAGQIVVAPDQWLEPVHRDDAVPVVRRIDETELTAIARRIEQARGQIDAVADVLRAYAPGAFLSGLRYTLGADRVVVAFIGDAAEVESATAALESTLGISVHLEQERSGDAREGLHGGGTYRLATDQPETFRELLEQRFDVLRNPGTFAPQGLPRLGSRVQTEHGMGQLSAVEIRHWRATVTLDTGEDVIVSVDELRQPPGAADMS